VDEVLFELWVAFMIIVIMMGFARMILIVALRFMPYERACKVALWTVAVLSLPILVPGKLWLGLALLAGIGLLTWQLSLRREEPELGGAPAGDEEPVEAAVPGEHAGIGAEPAFGRRLQARGQFAGGDRERRE
jgi:hypothetical protein